MQVDYLPAGASKRSSGGESVRLIRVLSGVYVFFATKKCGTLAYNILLAQKFIFTSMVLDPIRLRPLLIGLALVVGTPVMATLLVSSLSPAPGEFLDNDYASVTDPADNVFDRFATPQQACRDSNSNIPSTVGRSLGVL